MIEEENRPSNAVLLMMFGVHVRLAISKYGYCASEAGAHKTIF